VTRSWRSVPRVAASEVAFHIAAALIATALMAQAVSDVGSVRLVLAVSGMCLAFAAALVAPRALLYLLIIWLGVLGLTRRVTSLAFPGGPSDPLLLIEAVAVGALVLTATARGGLRCRSTLAKGALVLSILMLIGALNPAQGGLATGAAGLLFGLVPLGGFWIGRAFCDDRTFAHVLHIVAVFALAAAVYGLRQTFAGFPAWDDAWIRQADYEALHVGSVTRPFGTFSSASEYAAFVAVAIIVWVGFGFRRARAWLAVPAVCLLAVALWFESSRGAIFLVPVALVLMLAARVRRTLVLGLVGAGVVVLLVPMVVTHLGPASPKGAQAALVEHQVEGLKNPLDSSASTLAIHTSLVVDGLRNALHEPLGLGTGVVTIAGSKFGGETRGTEADPSNAAVALGVPGLLAYLVVLVAGFRNAYALAARRRDACSLAALGLLAVMVLQWLNGGQYSVALLVWLTLGWLDRASEARPEPEDATPRTPVGRRVAAVRAT
jgi:hypothetical protein